MHQWVYILCEWCWPNTDCGHNFIWMCLECNKKEPTWYNVCVFNSFFQLQVEVTKENKDWRGTVSVPKNRELGESTDCRVALGCGWSTSLVRSRCTGIRQQNKAHLDTDSDSQGWGGKPGHCSLWTFLLHAAINAAWNNYPPLGLLVLVLILVF